MIPPDKSSTAWQILEKISIADSPESGDYKAAVQQLREGFDPDALMSLTVRQGMAPIVADFLDRNDLMTLMPRPVRAALRGSLHWNSHVTNEYTAEASRIVSSLERAGVSVACNKGVVLQATLYHCRNVRFFSDVDLMIRPEDKEATAEVLRSHGYAEGKRYDFRTRRLVSRPRAEIITYKLYPDHLPHFYRLPADSSLPFFMVDVAYNLTWYGCSWQIPMSEVLGTVGRVPVSATNPERTLPALSASYGFLFLVTHLFREAWFERTIRDKGVRLTQFADVLRYWRRYSDTYGEEIRALIAQYELGPVVAWVCHYVDQLFDSHLIEQVGKLDTYLDPGWLRSAAAVDGSYLEWDGIMRHRLRVVGTDLALRQAKAPLFAERVRNYSKGRG